METRLPQDFKEFLALLSSAKIEYLIVDGYAVSYHGYPRPTGDLDIWIAISSESSSKIVKVLQRFGFVAATAEHFQTPGNVVRMGVPPVRLEIVNRISGVEFSSCYSRRIEDIMDGVPVKLIARDDLLVNKKAAGRAKDINDVEQLSRR